MGRTTERERTQVLAGWKKGLSGQCIKMNKAGNYGKGRGCFQTELLPRLYLHTWAPS